MVSTIVHHLPRIAIIRSSIHFVFFFNNRWPFDRAVTDAIVVIIVVIRKQHIWACRLPFPRSILWYCKRCKLGGKDNNVATVDRTHQRC